MFGKKLIIFLAIAVVVFGKKGKKPPSNTDTVTDSNTDTVTTDSNTDTVTDSPSTDDVKILV